MASKPTTKTTQSSGKASANVDMNILNDAQQRAEMLKSIYSLRDAAFDKYEKMYLMNWTSAPNTDGIQVTISPDARNKVLGAKRLLTSTVPKPAVVKDSLSNKQVDNTDEVEEACKRIIFQSGKVFRMPIHYAAVESALLYGEIHMAISDTATMAVMASQRNKARADDMALQTTHLIEVWNPRYGYPEYDAYGLSGYLRRTFIKAGEIPSRFGQAGEDWFVGQDSTTDVELDIWWDVENYAVWVAGTPLIAEVHGLPFIPISTTLIDGSTLFEKPEMMRQPMLYGLDKSGLWERQNLALTVMYTNIFNLGVNPTFKHNAPPSNPDKKLSWDGSVPGGVIDLEPGESFEPMVTKGVIDPSFQQGYQIANEKTDESTMYNQALGQLLPGTNSYSTINLMSQAGRLPLASTQKMTEQAFSTALEMCLKWYKISKKALKGWPIKPADVSDTIQITCGIDIDLAQDKLQMANVGGMILDKGLADMAWVRREILNIQEGDTMDEAVATDKFFAGMVQAYMQSQIPAMVQQLMQQQQAQQPGQAQQGMPTAADQVPGNAQQANPPDMQQLAQEAQQAQQQGGVQGQGFNPAMGGTPPVQAGQLPPDQQAMMAQQGGQ